MNEPPPCSLRKRTCGRRWMVVISVALCLSFILAQTPVDAGRQTAPSSQPGPGEDEHLNLMRDKFSDGKRKLAQSVLKGQLRNRDSVSVTPAIVRKLGTIKGSAASTFRSFNQSFILVGKVLYRLATGPGQSSFMTESVAEFDKFLGDVAFVESVEWDGLLFLLAAYKHGFMQLFTVAPDNKVVQRQSVTCYGIPTDAEFFMQDEKLFLVVTARNASSYVPVVVYRWYGTHLDEENRNVIIEASAVSTFPFQESVIIVVAVNATSNQKAGLRILRRTGRRLEVVQFKQTSEISSLQHFTFRSENYVLVTNTDGHSVIFWWAGTEMIEWDVLENDGLVRSIGVGYVRGETIILLAQMTEVKIYRPTATSLQLIAKEDFGSPVQSASLYTQGESIFMFAITEKEGTFVPFVIELQIFFQPATVSHGNLVRHPLLQCISRLQVDLKTRRSVLQDIVSHRKLLLRKSTPGIFKGKLIIQKLVQNNATIRSLINIHEEEPKLSAIRLRQEISQILDDALSLSNSSKNIVFKSKPSTFLKRLLAEKLVIHNANMDSVTITKLNGKRFDPKNILMYSKDQKLSGKITVNKIVADTIAVGSLNDIRVEDLLLRRGNQTILGLEQVTNIKATDIIINSRTINGIYIDQIVTTKLPGRISVTGTKTFSGLTLQQLVVGLMNNVNFTQWISSLTPVMPVFPTLEPPSSPAGPNRFVFQGNLSLTDLTVRDSINGVNFDDLLSSLFLKGLNQHIQGDVKYSKKITVGDLKASNVNGVPTANLLTRTTNQVISGSLTLESLNAPDLVTGSINGLVISKDAAYVNSPIAVSTPVTFQRLQSYDLKLPPHAHIAGQPVGKRLLYQPKIIYEASVKVKGSLKLTDANLEHARVLLGGSAIDVKNLHLHYWTKNSDQEIQVPLEAPNGLSVTSLNVQTINSISVEKLVGLTSTEVLQGSWHFPSAIISGNLVHDKNAVQLPISPQELSSSIVKTSGDYTVTGTKIFVGGLTTKFLTTEYLDSYKVQDFIRSGSKHYAGDYLYEEIWTGGNLIVHSDLFLGSLMVPSDATNATHKQVNLCDRLSKALLIDRPGHIPSAVISTVTTSNINVNTFNGVPIEVIVGHNDTVTSRVRKITVKGDVHVPAFLNVLSINDKAVTTDYLSRVVDRTKGGVIRGKKTFASKLTVLGTFDALDYNSMRMKDLFENVLSKTRDQRILSRISMKEMITNELRVTFVNEIPVRSLLTSDLMSRQTVEGNLIFTNDVDVMGTLFAADLENGCNLSMLAERLHTLDGRHWASMTVEGNLDWTRSLPVRVPGLSYYLGSAVTKNGGKQIIVADVVFDRSVTVNNFNSRNDINDVDISSILTDSLRKSLPDQVIHANKLFTNKLYSTSMSVMGNVLSKTVAGVDIARFNTSLIRVSGDQDVGGHKRFLHGFSADLLRIDGTLNGLVTSNVANYDLPNLSPIHFKGPFEIIGDLNFERVNDFSLDELLRDRVTLDSPQQLQGHINFTRDLTIEGDMVAPSINRVDLAQTVDRESLHEQVIGGKKHFVQGLRVDGPMEVDYLDGALLRMAHNAALFRDENATIYGNLVFGNIVTMGTNLDISTTVNSVEMADLSKRLRTVSTRSLAHFHSIARTITDTNALLKARGDPSELLYLEPVLEIPTLLANTHKVVATTVGRDTYLDAYGWAPASDCGLPEPCLCPSHYSLQPSHDSFGTVLWKSGLHKNSSERSFTFYLEKSHVTLLVKTNTISSSSKCRLFDIARLNELTMITWIDSSPNEESNEVFGETMHFEPIPILGYISDVKVLTAENRIYLVFGIGYNADLETTDLNSVIIRVDRVTRKATVVREFPTHGVSVIEVFYTDKGPHVVVGNTFDTTRGSSQVYLDIYRFNVLTEQLLLVKSIPADNVVAISSIVQGGDSLIVVAQKQLYAPVMVLKYDSAHDDYHFMQQLNPNTIPMGLGVFYVGHPGQSDAFLGVSTADDQFYLYKFCHIEGFKQIMKMGIEGVTGFTTFSVQHKQYLFFTSSKASTVFEVVKQSS